MIPLLLILIAALCGWSLWLYRVGYAKGHRMGKFEAMLAWHVRDLAKAPTTALETSRNATVYHDTSSTGPLVATWTLERKH